MTRNLNAQKQIEIQSAVEADNFDDIYHIKGVNYKWSFCKNKILSILNKVALLQNKCVKPKDKDQFPWIDIEFLQTKQQMDLAYKKVKSSNANHTETKHFLEEYSYLKRKSNLTILIQLK
jgi:hypothetical protein